MENDNRAVHLRIRVSMYFFLTFPCVVAKVMLAIEVNPRAKVWDSARISIKVAFQFSVQPKCRRTPIIWVMLLCIPFWADSGTPSSPAINWSSSRLQYFAEHTQFAWFCYSPGCPTRQLSWVLVVNIAPSPWLSAPTHVRGNSSYIQDRYSVTQRAHRCQFHSLKWSDISMTSFH